MNFRQIFLGGFMMKNITGCSIVLRIIVVSLCMNIFCSSSISACPTCIGTIDYNSPKFFSDDAYQSQQQVQGHSALMQKEEE